MTPDLNRDRLSHNPNPQQTAEIGQRVLIRLHKAVAKAYERREFDRLEDGDWHWFPSLQGALPASALRAIADELDRLNGIDNAPST